MNSDGARFFIGLLLASIGMSLVLTNIGFGLITFGVGLWLPAAVRLVLDRR